MRIPASWFGLLHYPCRCEKRLRLHYQGAPSEPLGPFEELLVELGSRHERNHLSTLPEYLDVSQGTNQERLERTLDELKRHRSILYQPLLMEQCDIDGIRHRLIGAPDFMLPSADGWLVRDAKLAHSIEKPHILGQVNFYGFLFELIQGQSPAALEVVLGTGDIASTPYLGRDQVVDQIRGLVWAIHDDGKYEPVGWSKCAGCGFRGICWPKAVEKRDVATLPDVDQGLARLLHEEGCHTIEDLAAHYDHDLLAEVVRPWGPAYKRVGKRAGSILAHVQAFLENRVVVLAPPNLPEVANVASFDLEGLPPHVDDLEKVFLWGLRVYGDRPTSFQYACSFPGKADDEATWFSFLELARRIFADYGDIPFVHWANYERAKIDLYLTRYGDRDGIAARVRGNLLDLLRVVSKSVCLPLPTRSLKEVEKYVGFKRQLAGSGDWAISQYIRATELGDPDEAQKVLDQILAYNQEDLAATWAVYRWLREGNY